MENINSNDYSYQDHGWEKNRGLTERPLHFSTAEELSELSKEVAHLILNIEDLSKAEEIVNNILVLADQLAAYRNNGLEIFFEEKEEVLSTNLKAIKEKLGMK